VKKNLSFQQTLVCLALAITAILALAPPASANTGISGKNMIGVRLGPWLADGFTKDIRTPEITVNSSSTAFHLEFFYLYNLKGPLYLDFNLGAVSRGDIRFDYASETYRESAIGTAGVYPLGVGFQIYPFAVNRTQKWQPFVMAGGSLVIGTETFTYVTESYLGSYLGVDAQSREALGWYAGGGLNIVLAETVSLSLLAKYQHAKFSEELVGVKDFSGAQILFGAAYMYK